MAQAPEKPDSAARLRGDLDAGRGRDKVAYPDPAAAPLGTDDEAAGTPVTDEQARIAREQEIRNTETPRTDPARTTGGSDAPTTPGADRISDAEADPSVASTRHGSSGRVKTAIVVVIALVVVMLLVAQIL